MHLSFEDKSLPGVSDEEIVNLLFFYAPKAHGRDGVVQDVRVPVSSKSHVASLLADVMGNQDLFAESFGHEVFDLGDPPGIVGDVRDGHGLRIIALKAEEIKGGIGNRDRRKQR